MYFKHVPGLVTPRDHTFGDPVKSQEVGSLFVTKQGLYIAYADCTQVFVNKNDSLLDFRYNNNFQNYTDQN